MTTTTPIREVSQSFVAKYEGGERRLDVVEFIQVAQVLGKSPQKIVGALVQQK